MTVTGNRTISWRVPKDFSEPDQTVVVSIKDAKGQQVYHTFRLIFPEVKTATGKPKQEQRRDIVDRRRQRNDPSHNIPPNPNSKSQAVNDTRTHFGSENSNRRQPNAKSESKRRENSNMNRTEIPQPSYQVRTWIDSSGEYKVKALFVRIHNKKTVMLRDENGKVIRIPLNKLSPTDIFRAVENELKRVDWLKNQKEKMPIDKGPKSGAAVDQ